MLLWWSHFAVSTVEISNAILCYTTSRSSVLWKHWIQTSPSVSPKDWIALFYTGLEKLETQLIFLSAASSSPLVPMHSTSPGDGLTLRSIFHNRLRRQRCMPQWSLYCCEQLHHVALEQWSNSLPEESWGKSLTAIPGCQMLSGQIHSAE